MIAALFLLTVVLSRDSLFHRSQSVVVVFQDVMGLRVGDMVSARGVTVGKVKAIELQAKGVHVHVLLDKPIHLREDYHISVMPTSVLGGRFLNIDEGTLDREPIPMPALLAGSLAVTGLAMLHLMQDQRRPIQGICYLDEALALDARNQRSLIDTAAEFGFSLIFASPAPLTTVRYCVPIHTRNGSNQISRHSWQIIEPLDA